MGGVSIRSESNQTHWLESQLFTEPSWGQAQMMVILRSRDVGTGAGPPYLGSRGAKKLVLPGFKVCSTTSWNKWHNSVPQFPHLLNRSDNDKNFNLTKPVWSGLIRSETEAEPGRVSSICLTYFHICLPPSPWWPPCAPHGPSDMVLIHQPLHIKKLCLSNMQDPVCICNMTGS